VPCYGGVIYSREGHTAGLGGVKVQAGRIREKQLAMPRLARTMQIHVYLGRYLPAEPPIETSSLLDNPAADPETII